MNPLIQENFVSFTEALNSSLTFHLYGKPVKAGDVFSDFSTSRTTSSQWTLALIHAYMINNKCYQLPKSILLLLPGTGAETIPSDKCAKEKDRVWSVIDKEEIMVIDAQVGMLSDILEDPSTKGIDGGVTLSNPRLADGKVCVDIHIWAEIRVFGRKVGFNERFTQCIPIEGCYTVWSIGIASLELCFRAPNQICAKLCAGKWGIDKCWDYCIQVSLNATNDNSSNHGGNCTCNT